MKKIWCQIKCNIEDFAAACYVARRLETGSMRNYRLCLPISSSDATSSMVWCVDGIPPQGYIVQRLFHTIRTTIKVVRLYVYTYRLVFRVPVFASSLSHICIFLVVLQRSLLHFFHLLQLLGLLLLHHSMYFIIHIFNSSRVLWKNARSTQQRFKLNHYYSISTSGKTIIYCDEDFCE